MFERNENISESRGSKKVSAVLQVGLMVLLAQGPIYATDPIDVDPDPDFASPTKTIVVDSLDRLNVEDLPPGHYLIVVIADDGTKHSFEIRVD